MTTDEHLVTLKWAGRHIDGSPARGFLQLSYDGGTQLDGDGAVFPAERSVRIVRASISGVDVGYAEVQVLATNSGLPGSGGTYHLTEILTGGGGRSFSFVADIDADDRTIWISHLGGVDASPAAPVSAVTFADLLRLSGRIYNLELGGGGGGTSPAALVVTRTDPVGSWTIPHGFGRVPSVQLYVADQLVFADVHATPTEVVVSFATPTAATAVLT